MATYNQDFNLWAIEQAQLLRAGRFAELDIENLSEEVESVGRSEKRELASRMQVLLAHLLKWQYQSERRGSSWQSTIRTQRSRIEAVLEDSPSLKPKLSEQKWLEMIWSGALLKAMEETGINIEIFPQDCPWDMQTQILNPDWLP